MKIKNIITIPALIRLWKRYVISRSEAVVIVPHGNLGDLVAIYSGIIELSKSNKVIYLCCKRNLFIQIHNIYGFPSNVKNIRYFDCYRKFRMSKKREYSIARYGKVLKLGYFGNNRVFKYPDSFYDEMGIDKGVSEKFIILRDLDNRVNEELKIINDMVDGNYIYVNTLSTHCDDDSSDLEIIKKSNKRSIIHYINEEKIGLFNLTDEKNIEISIEKSSSLMLNIAIAKRAEALMLSDAGFFNIAIRSFKNFTMTIRTRKNKNSHNKNLYPLALNGQLYKWNRVKQKDRVLPY